MADVIQADFSPEFFDQLYRNIKYSGVKRTESEYIKAGFHPSFVRVAIRRILRRGDW